MSPAAKPSSDPNQISSGARKTVKCPKCQLENVESAKFCNECGYSFTVSLEASSQAASFHEGLQKIQRYLPKGLTEKILADKDKIEGERRQVTVMFCDMEGFVPLVDRLGPEEAYRIMDQVYEILIHKVHDYEGTVNELTGDGIMALFGAPIALEDAPQRALWSALSIHDEIAEFNDQKKGVRPIKMRIGVHTGAVVVGTLGNDLRVEFKAVGDTVNLASRMEGLAEPDTTYVTEDTFKLTEKLFHFEDLGVREIKGKKEASHVYKLLSAKEDVYRPRLGFERMIYSEMVGRDDELNRLGLQVVKVIEGQGSIVNIIGEPGIGKSRLVAELKKYELMNQVTLLEGRAISIGRNLPFHPIIDLLKHWSRIREDDGEATAFEKLEAAVKNVCQEEVHEILPFVATLMGMKLSGRYAQRVKGIEGEALEKLILKNLRDLLTKATDLTPLLIVAEDLHWADTSTIEFMESLSRLVENHRILFVNVFRPGHRETGDRITASIKKSLPQYYVELKIEPLDGKMSQELIRKMLKMGELKHIVMRQIVQRAGGNPFFIEEVVRSFIDENVVVLKDGKFEVTEKIEEKVIPHTIIDLLMERIDRLDDETRSLIKIAAVIGRNFFYRILKEVANSVENIDSKLTYLKNLQLVMERKRMEEIEYLFKHALVQEVVYDSILKKNRKEVHLTVAHSFESTFNKRLHEFYGILAYHYTQAEDLDKTEEYLIKAGEEALRSSASSEALTYYQLGLNLYRRKYKDAADPEKLATFEKNIALALFNKGQLESASDYFDKVLERWGAGSPKNRVIVASKLVYDLLGVIINLYFPSKKIRKVPTKRENEIFDLRFKKAVSLVHLDPVNCFIEFIGTLNKIVKFDTTKVKNGIAIWMSGSGLFSWSGMSFKLSKKMLDYNKDIINRMGIKEVLYYDLYELLHHSYLGNWLGVKNYDENLVEENLKIGEFWHVSTYLAFHGYISVAQGAFEKTELIINKLLEISKDYGNENGREYWHTLKIKLLLQFGRLQDALKEADKGISFLTESGRETGIIFYLGFKAVIQVRLMDFDGANTTLARTREIAATNIRTLPTYLSGSLLGQFLLDLHLMEQSIKNNKSDISKLSKKTYQSGRRAIKNSKKYAFNRTELFRLMGLYYWLLGKNKKAIGFWKKGIKEAEHMRAYVELARIYMETGRRCREMKSRDLQLYGIDIDEHLNRARILFEDMGLEHDLEKLNEIIAN
jgi:class 3 adenylate cyclase/tetratricopeptide (TPR) repeat protein